MCVDIFLANTNVPCSSPSLPSLPAKLGWLAGRNNSDSIIFLTIVRQVRDGNFHSRIILNSHNVRASEILTENVRGLPLDGFVTLIVTLR